MIYWKHIDIGDYHAYASSMMQYIDSKINLDTCKFWNPLLKGDAIMCMPELVKGLSAYGEIKEMAVLVLRPDLQSTLHIDHTAGLNNGVKARINLPILNCEGSVTSFYNLQPEHEKNHKTNAGGTKYWPLEYRLLLTPVSSVELISPTILRISEPHTVFCNTNKYPRITLTVSMIDDVEKYLK
jgi:hypothetical protein